MSSLTRVLVWFRLVGIVLLSTLMLSGCVRYNLGVNFDSSNQGAIVQQIRLDERLTTGQAWLNDVENRARKVEGKIRRVSDQEVWVTIPFGSGKELEAKFNEFFSSDFKNTRKKRSAKTVDLPKIDSHLTVKQGNFLLLERTRLIYDLDLRSLGVQSSDGSLLLSPGSLIELEFDLTTPWRARNVGATQVRRSDKHLIWTLQPGQKNHLEATFWMPSPLGIGAVVIGLLVAGGIYLKRNDPPQPSFP
ncbi:DUF3153 domain-containing protein [Phormidesmis sp. 146-12]